MISSLLFVLTGSFAWISFISAATLVSWFVLSDFFMTDRFKWWGAGFEEWAFSLPSVGVAALIVVVHYYCVQRVLAAAAPRIELVPECKFLTADNVAVVLSAVANSEPWRQPKRFLFGMVACNVPSRQARRFLRWKVKCIERIDPRREMKRPWWSAWSPRVIGRWIAISWFPALLIILYWAPATPLFEPLVSRLMCYRIGIFNVAAEGLNPGPPPGVRTRTGMWVKESLVHDTVANAWCRSETALVTTGTLTLSTTRFPHLSHRLLAICAGETPNCAIALNGQAPVPDADIPVRNGQAQLQFHQVTADWHLNMIVRLQRPNGTIIDQTVIDAAGCR
jgi:hypothetical protein